MTLEFSFIIPVYNRPQEIKELLDSFVHMQTSEIFEIVIIEDGSTLSSETIVTDFKAVSYTHLTLPTTPYV